MATEFCIKMIKLTACREESYLWNHSALLSPACPSCHRASVQAYMDYPRWPIYVILICHYYTITNTSCEPCPFCEIARWTHFLHFLSQHLWRRKKEDVEDKAIWYWLTFSIWRPHKFAFGKEKQGCTSHKHHLAFFFLLLKQPITYCLNFLTKNKVYVLNDIIVVRRATRGVSHYMGLARGMRDLYWSQYQAADNWKFKKV